MELKRPQRSALCLTTFVQDYDDAFILGQNPQDGRPIEVIVDDGRVQAIVPGRVDQEAWLSPGSSTCR